MPEYPLKDGAVLYTRYPLPEAAEIFRVLKQAQALLVNAVCEDETWEKAGSAALELLEDFSETVNGR